MSMFDFLFEDKTVITSTCDLNDAHIEISQDETRKIDGITGYIIERQVKSKSITILGVNGNETLKINITGDFHVTVESIERNYGCQ